MNTVTTTERGFTIVRRLAASRELVFAAWTDPDHLLRWFANLPPREPVTVDLRVGGAWRLDMVENPERAYVTGGIYREIDPPESLAFSWGAVGGWPDIDPGRLDDVPLVTVTLRTVPGVSGEPETEMVVHVGLSEALTDEEVKGWFDLGIRDGMTQTIDRIVTVLDL